MKTRLSTIATCILVLSLITSPAFSQTLQWLKQINSNDMAENYGITTDTSGNVYTVGAYTGTASINGFSLTSPAVAYTHGFISKMDSSGSLLWAKKFGGSGNDYCYGITIDAHNDPHITGGFGDNAVFGSQTYTPVGYLDGFVSKMTSTGSFSWVTRFGGPGSLVSGKAIVTDHNGNSYVTGTFRDNPCGFGSFTLTPQGWTDVFLMKLDASGNIMWVKQFGGAMSDEAHDICLDNSGNIYCSGAIGGGTANIGSYSLFGQANQDGFVCKTDPQGNVQWVKHFKGSGAVMNRAFGLAKDQSGNIYTAGRFGVTMVVDSYTLTQGEGSFVAKMDQSGTISWIKGFTGAGRNYITDLAIDKANTLFLTGSFEGEATFGNTTLSTNTDLTYRDAFILKMDASGNVTWVKRFRGPQTENGMSITTHSTEQVYAAGNFMATSTIDNYSVTAVGGQEVYIVKFGVNADPPPPPPTAIEEISLDGALVYPNPSAGKISIILPDLKAPLRVSVSSVLGAELMSVDLREDTQIDISMLPKGVYFLKLNVKDHSVLRKVVKE